MPVPDSQKRICVIGAGPSGTSVLRAFKSAQEKGAQIPEIVCYEKQSEWGGLWNFSWRTGTDQYGETVHNSQYRHLWSNGPKECLEFADYSFDEHFGVTIPSYPPREVLRDYIVGRVEKSGVKPWVQCNSLVRDCAYDQRYETFQVRVKDLVTGTEVTEEFSHVCVCSGHFSTPNVPEFQGMETFTGRCMHAHDFRSAEEFAGLRILVIGTSYSAEDIASQCYKYGVKSVHCSWRTAPMGFHWPANFTTVPLLTNVDGRICTFKDGSSAEIDVIIMCTGYLHHFPFMREDIRLTTANRLCLDTLHEGIMWPDNQKLFYIGMQDQWFTFNKFDAQAWFARDVILGRITVPSRKVMDKEWQQWRDREDNLDSSDEAKIRYQADYVKSLIARTDYPSFDMEGVVQTFLEWEHNKHENIMTFRDKPHRSLMTGSMAPVHHTPWVQAWDDSIECYVPSRSSSAAAVTIGRTDTPVPVAVSGRSKL